MDVKNQTTVELVKSFVKEQRIRLTVVNILMLLFTWMTVS